jgi:hypothetical protein
MKLENFSTKHVIHCPTLDLAERVFKLLNIKGKTGYRRDVASTSWEKYKELTCYNVHQGDYHKITEYLKHKYKIVKAVDFIESNEEKKLKPVISTTAIQYALKRENRFSLNFPSEFNIESWLVQSVNKPQVRKNPNGEYIWTNLNVEFIDPIGPSVTQKLYLLFMNKVIKFKCELFSLDPIGIPVEKWEIYIKGIESINFGNCSYENNALNKPKISLSVDKCELIY